MKPDITLAALGVLALCLAGCSSGSKSSPPTQSNFSNTPAASETAAIVFEDVVSAFDAAYIEKFQINLPPLERGLLAICRGDRSDPAYPAPDPKPDDVGELGWQIDTCGGLANEIGERGTDTALRAREYLVLFTENTVIPSLVNAGKIRPVEVEGYKQILRERANRERAYR